MHSASFLHYIIPVIQKSHTVLELDDIMEPIRLDYTMVSISDKESLSEVQIHSNHDRIHIHACVEDKEI